MHSILNEYNECICRVLNVRTVIIYIYTQAGLPSLVVVCGYYTAVVIFVYTHARINYYVCF